MKTFNLTQALRGEKVITRSGLKVSSVNFTKNIVYAEINEKFYQFTKEGKLLNSPTKSKYDLFMKPSTLTEYLRFFFKSINTKNRHF